MSTTNTTHCRFSGIMEILNPPSNKNALNISFSATLQGPLYTSMSTLKTVDNILLQIDFYNALKEEDFIQGAVIFCQGTLSVQESSSEDPKLNVKANSVIG
jgi:hypothetical protein